MSVSESVDGEREDLDRTRPLSTLEAVQDLVLGSKEEGPQAETINTISDSAGAYRYYIKFSGRLRFAIFLILCAIFVFGMTFNRKPTFKIFSHSLFIFVENADTPTEYWIARWAKESTADPERRRGFYIGLYFGIGAIQLVAWTAAA